MNDLVKRVKKANRAFYDRVGTHYECLDGRRSDTLAGYVENQIIRAVAKGSQSCLLDLGCGNGFVSRLAAPHFDKRFGLDVSFNVIRGISEPGVVRIQGDCDSLPFHEGSLDCVAAFAVLHHCCSYKEMVGEIFRVLKPGGVFYSDHDMDEEFFGRFMPLIQLYRRIKGGWGRYKCFLNPGDRDLYRCSEIHEDGIPSRRIESCLKHAGFKRVSMDFHWYGLSGWTDMIFGKKTYKQGRAPLVRILAAK